MFELLTLLKIIELLTIQLLLFSASLVMMFWAGVIITLLTEGVIHNNVLRLLIEKLEMKHVHKITCENANKRWKLTLHVIVYWLSTNISLKINKDILLMRHGN